MGANAQTTVPTFTASQVLTADQMNQSARTGVPVFADTTARDAAFGGTGEKTLAEGQLAYIEASNVVQYYDGATWGTVGPSSAGGLVRVAGGSFTTATSVSFPNDTFTATYDNYVCMIRVDTLTADATFSIRLRAAGSDNTNSDYWRVIAGSQVSATSWSAGEGDTTPRYFLILNLLGPKLTARTGMFQQQFNINQAGNAYAYNDGGGVFDATTSFDSASFISSVASSMTGSYNVYGYTLS